MSPNVETCTSCGMPMRSAGEHAQGDPAKAYCRFCAAPDGALKSYDEVLAGIAGFLKKTQGIDETAAREAARDMMSQLPAWRKNP